MESCKRLIAAAKAGDEQSVSKLLDEGTEITSSIEHGINGLHYAAKAGHEGVVRTFLKYGIDVNIRPRTARCCTALIYAAEEGHLATVRVLLNHGADPTIRNNIHQHSAIIWAANKGLVTVVAELLPHVTWNEDWDDQMNIAFLEMAKANNYKNIFEMFVNWLKIKMTQEELDKKMITASIRGKEGLVNGLLHAGANLEARDDSGLNGLNLAINAGHLEVVKIFLNHASISRSETKRNMKVCNINMLNEQLRDAATSGDNEALRELIRRGANVNRTPDQVLCPH